MGTNSFQMRFAQSSYTASTCACVFVPFSVDASLHLRFGTRSPH